MPSIKFEFPNGAGEMLAGRLELPPDSVPVAAYAIFAHCFTCGKDSAAASRISRALAERGIGVLRFDFTGLGNSDGDFANSNFSSNVQDLLAAAGQLEAVYAAPSLLVGHSLGGAAVLIAAPQLASVTAVVTIAAPATADHVRHMFSSAGDRLQTQGQVELRIGTREFTIKQQLLDDLENYASAGPIRHLGKPLLIFHSPLDEVVSINEAAAIYRAASQPKSFISLDRADHLLSKKADTEYVADTLAAWASRYLELVEYQGGRWQGDAPGVAANEILVTEVDKKFLSGLHSDRHQLLADEPVRYGGTDLGPSPYDLLLMALGACTSMTLRMYATKKQLPLESIEVRLRHERIHAEDCAECDDREGRVERITRSIYLDGELSPEQKQRLLEIADRCPIHRTLGGQPVIVTRADD